ncbi:hypothetical protein PFDG_05265, partial [Plasmodium falciparum Dd2]
VSHNDFDDEKDAYLQHERHNEEIILHNYNDNMHNTRCNHKHNEPYPDQSCDGADIITSDFSYNTHMYTIKENHITYMNRKSENIYDNMRITNVQTTMRSIETMHQTSIFPNGL